MTCCRRAGQTAQAGREGRCYTLLSHHEVHTHARTHARTHAHAHWPAQRFPRLPAATGSTGQPPPKSKRVLPTGPPATTTPHATHGRASSLATVFWLVLYNSV